MAISQIVSKERAKSKSPLERLSQAMDLAQLAGSLGGQVSDFAKGASTTPDYASQYALWRQKTFPQQYNLGNYASKITL